MLQSLRFKAFANTSLYDKVLINSLEEWCAFIQKTGCHWYAEIKSPISDNDLQNIISIIQSYDLDDCVTIENGEYSNLQKLRKIAPRMNLGYVQFGEDNDIRSCINKALTLGNCYTALEN